MEHRDDDDFRRFDLVENDVRKPINRGLPDISVDFGVQEWIGRDTGYNIADLPDEVGSSSVC